VRCAQAGDHVHLGPGVTGTRVTDPAFPIEDLPSVDVVVLSHFHAGTSVMSFFVCSPRFLQPLLQRYEKQNKSSQKAICWTDHFDQLVQEKLRKDLPIVTTRHAEKELMGLEGNGGAFTDVVSIVRYHRDIVYATMGDMAISRRDRTSYTRRDARLICVMSITLLIQYGMEVWESTLLKITDTPGKSNKKPVVRVVATPGKSTARSDLLFLPISAPR
jgi:hypothetical protein